MTPYEFFAALQGHREYEEYRSKEMWEATRWQTTCLINIQLDRGKKVSPVDLIKFPWDTERDANIEDILGAGKSIATTEREDIRQYYESLKKRYKIH